MKTIVFISNFTEGLTCRISTAEPGEACLAAGLLKLSDIQSANTNLLQLQTVIAFIPSVTEAAEPPNYSSSSLVSTGLTLHSFSSV